MPTVPGTCMLMPVHEPDFLVLAARLQMQRRFAIGEQQPTNVVVFDDAAAEQAFCVDSSYRSFCSEPQMARLALNSLLGNERYQWVRGTLGIEANMHKSARVAQFNSPKSGCRYRSPGQVYQALKKFYGAIGGPAHCLEYFVSDAESCPFRPYDWRVIEATSMGHHLIAQWGISSNPACTGGHNDWGDPQCQQLIAKDLQLEPPKLRTRDYWQRVAAPDQLWIYNRNLVVEMVKEVEARMNVTFERAWVGWRFSDASFYIMWVHQSALNASAFGRPPHQLLRNLPAEIENALPEAYLQCCSCTNASNWMPCRRASDVVSPCMIRVAGPKKLATFLVERLGLFGSWHQFMPLPASVLNAREDGPSWCVNNCFNREFMQRLQLSSRVKPFIDSALAESSLVRRAFERQVTFATHMRHGMSARLHEAAAAAQQQGPMEPGLHGSAVAVQQQKQTSPFTARNTSVPPDRLRELSFLLAHTNADLRSSRTSTLNLCRRIQSKLDQALSLNITEATRATVKDALALVADGVTLQQEEAPRESSNASAEELQEMIEQGSRQLRLSRKAAFSLRKRLQAKLEEEACVPLGDGGGSRSILRTLLKETHMLVADQDSFAGMPVRTTDDRQALLALHPPEAPHATEASLRYHPWPCSYGYTHVVPAETLEDRHEFMGFSQYIMEEVMHRALVQRAGALGLAGVVLLNSPVVMRVACCTLRWAGLCMMAKPLIAWHKYEKQFCTNGTCPAFVVVIGYPFDTVAVTQAMAALMEMPRHFLRNVMILSYEDELPGAASKTATLHDVLTSRNVDLPAVIAAPHPTLALEHHVLPEEQRDIFLLADFWSSSFGRQIGQMCRTCPRLVGARASMLLREALARSLADTPSLVHIQNRSGMGGGVYLPKRRQSLPHGHGEAPSYTPTLMEGQPASPKSNLADRSEFCLEPPGDTPTRSHFYLAIISGCIPVIFDVRNQTVRNTQLSLDRARWAWRASRDGSSLLQWYTGQTIDYRKFAIIFQAEEVIENPQVVLSRLKAISAAEHHEMRRELMSARRFFGYRADESSGVDAVDVAAAVIRQFVHTRASKIGHGASGAPKNLGFVERHERRSC